MFSTNLLDAIGAENMQEVIKRNTETKDMTCATHDFCDANQVMLDTFPAAFGREYFFGPEEMEGEHPQEVHDHRLVIRSWDMAKANNFYLSL
jgi:hypothetical protein